MALGVLLTLLIGGCNAPTPTPDAPPTTLPSVAQSETPQPDLHPHIDDGVRFLRDQYHVDVGLLQESPAIGANRYYLTNDNLLAIHVLERLGIDAQWTRDLAAALAEYTDDLAALGLGAEGNGFVEAAWGEPIRWPPFHQLDVVVERLTAQPCDTFDHQQEDTEADAGGGPCVLYETHLGPGYFSDWSGFSNLACMAVVDEWKRGYAESARRLFARQMESFDGYGWPDLAHQRRNGAYETLGLA